MLCHNLKTSTIYCHRHFLLSRYKTVTVCTEWSENYFFEAFSVAMGRISYIVGDKPDFLSIYKIFVNFPESLHSE